MKKMLMLCHDQHLDRRVVSQAESLERIGINVTLACLSFSKDNETEQLSDNLTVKRLGLNNIIPENIIYRVSRAIHYHVIAVRNRLTDKISGNSKKITNKLFGLLIKINTYACQLALRLFYMNKNINDPLPFKKGLVGLCSNIEADVIQVHDLPALAAGVVLAKEKMIPLIYDAHELYPEQHSFSFIQKYICRRAEKELIRNCSLVFSVNDSIAKIMKKRYKVKQPITLLNAIDYPLNNISEKNNIIREKLSLSKDRKILLFQGGFCPNRNLDKLVKAMSLLQKSDIDLVLLGFGGYKVKLEVLSKKLELLNKRVYFLPAVSQEDLLKYSNSADVGIIPYPHIDLNSYYCTPNKLFEFIQAELPILANDSPELTKFVRQQGFGLIHAMSSPKQIANGIDNIFSDEQRLTMFLKNLKQKKANFSWEKQRQVYLHNVQKLLF